MSELDKMMAFGHWLTARQVDHGAQLVALSINAKVPVDALRVKAGHLEATTHILAAFKELYNGDLNKFKQEYLGEQPEEEEKESKDE